MIPVAIGQQVGPDGIPIPPNEDNVITDPDPEIEKPEILAVAVMKAVLKSKEDA